jgi:hypothetical protein
LSVLGFSEVLAKAVGDLLGDLVLHGEDVFEGAVVGLREEMVAVHAADQLRGDAHPVTRFPDAAFEDMRRAELAADFPDVHVFALEKEG